MAAEEVAERFSITGPVAKAVAGDDLASHAVGLRAVELELRADVVDGEVPDHAEQPGIGVGVALDRWPPRVGTCERFCGEVFRDSRRAHQSAGGADGSRLESFVELPELMISPGSSHHTPLLRSTVLRR